MAGDYGGSQIGIGNCHEAERRFWDAELNRIYRALIVLFKARDAELDDVGSAAPRSLPALRTAQRAWISWRDEQCAFVASTWGGGSGAGIAETECHAALTGAQALRLDEILAGSGG